MTIYIPFIVLVLGLLVACYSWYARAMTAEGARHKIIEDGKVIVMNLGDGSKLAMNPFTHREVMRVVEEYEPKQVPIRMSMSIGYKSHNPFGATKAGGA